MDIRFMLLFRSGAKGKDLTPMKCLSAGVGLIPSLGGWGRPVLL